MTITSAINAPSAPSLIEIEADIPIVSATPIDLSVVSESAPAVISNAQPVLDISNQQDHQITSDVVHIAIPFCLQSQTTVPELVEE
jgi:hypothetical protein